MPLNPTGQNEYEEEVSNRRHHLRVHAPEIPECLREDTFQKPSPSGGVAGRPARHECGWGAIIAVPGVVLHFIVARPASDQDELLIEVYRRGVRASPGIRLAVQTPKGLRHIHRGGYLFGRVTKRTVERGTEERGSVNP